MASNESQRYLLISAPRTASTMLIKILNLDEQGVRPARHGGYNFLPAMPKRYSLQPKPMTEWTAEEIKDVQAIEQHCFDNMQDYIEKANEEKQLIFLKEHAVLLNHPWYESQSLHGEGTTAGEPTPLVPRGDKEATRSEHNKTALSDEFLKTWRPTFLIRHPAMTFPSLFRMLRLEAFSRPNGEPNLVELTTYWQRKLLEFYESHFGEDKGWPIVLDADDIMTTPELVAKYALMVGFDEEKLRFSWDKLPQAEVDQLHPMHKDAHGSLLASDKIDPGKVAGEVDIDAEAVKWRADFGEDAAKRLEKHVRDAMPDYQYMRSKRMTLS